MPAVRVDCECRGLGGDSISCCGDEKALEEFESAEAFIFHERENAENAISDLRALSVSGWHRR